MFVHPCVNAGAQRILKPCHTPPLTLFQTRPTNEEYPIMQNSPKRALTSTVPDPLAIHMQMLVSKPPHLT